MAVLTGSQIKREVEDGRIRIDPYNPAMVNPNSIDVTLGNDFLLLRYCRVMDTECPITPEEIATWDVVRPDASGWLEARGGSADAHDRVVRVEDGQKLLIKPGWFLLGHTRETIWSEQYVPAMYGKSTIARCSVVPHQQAGGGDLNFSGQYTLEITSTLWSVLRPGMRIAQMWFFTTDGERDILYGQQQGKYDGQMGPTPARKEMAK
jgi:dCTP deaminase